MPPAIPDRFIAACDVAVAELSERADVVGVLVFGSVARGQATPMSDIDLYAITATDHRGHRGRVIDGVPVEVSFGSIAQFTNQVIEERAVVVNAFATGRILLDRAGGLAELSRRAAAIWSRGPAPLTADARLRFRFHLTDAVRDLEDVRATGVESALPAAMCVQMAIDALYGVRSAWAPAPRHVVQSLRSFAPDVAAQVERCAGSGFPARLAAELACDVLQLLGGRLEEYDTSRASFRSSSSL
ncbi:hypothetical protein BH11GEM1_BH11GEM1_16350 [soil metagenome]